jgi:cyclic pyranopterin phosphate synthase
MTLTHLDEHGRPRMVDVSGKAETARSATAEALVRLTPAALRAARDGGPKGDALRIAELAGVMGAKRTADLIPLCHPLPLSGVTVAITLEDGAARIEATARTTAQTGVEMEALTAASIAALTLYDMLKAVDKGLVIERVRLLAKSGGKSGDWRADQPAGG